MCTRGVINRCAGILPASVKCGQEASGMGGVLLVGRARGRLASRMLMADATSPGMEFESRMRAWVYSVPASNASSTLAFLRAGPAVAATAAAAPPVLVRS